MKPIVVVGSINMDLVSQTERIPKPGETLIGTGFQTHSGGKGANQAVAVARLGHACILLGALGDDLFGDELLATLKGFGVNTQYLARVGGASGTASIVVDSRGENTIIVIPGANLAVTPEYLETKKDVLRGAGIVLTQLETPLTTLSWLAVCCKELGVPLMLDPAPAQELPPALFAGVEWFTPNQTETAFYAKESASSEDTASGKSTLGSESSADSLESEATLGRLFRSGVRNVILKEGADGVLLAKADGTRERVPAVPVKAVDTTAAGDSFNGAFAVALMRGLPLAESARFAAAAAAVSVTRHGAQSSLPNDAEVQGLLRRNDPAR